ncbi:hypothetical protein SAMN02745165_03700 [Malonomonas rubra DSM 5091]|uniref:Uncharacterized protein n=1 Tax=Malonomonas rubra DSM 5091 TaxID=1122189 RepID=A0A1M6NTE1_MALRU|nr:hypothetical protein [Malonomonas rubra]SHJ98920.1 hypothetical protein SAMN02745165_03700 [Malonomonas rubra DSM 5091]
MNGAGSQKDEYENALAKNNILAKSWPVGIFLLTCVESCPHKSLSMSLGGLRRPLLRWVFPVVVLSIYVAGISMVSGHWESALGYQDYQWLVPMIDRFNH